MKKVLIFICTCFCLLTLVGCRSVSELTKANEELNGNNYTVYYQTHKNVTYGVKEVSDEKDEYLVKQNGKQKIVSTWDDEGTRLDVFTEVKEDSVEFFKGNGRYWEFDRVESLEEYQVEEILPKVEINEDNFVYEDKVWVGNVELINTALKDYFNELALEFDSYKGFVDAEITSKVNKYNVTLVNNQISKIEFDYQVLVTFVDKSVLTIAVDILAEYSDIFQTVINKPEGVLDLSYAVKPTDNYTAELYYELLMPTEDGDTAAPGVGAQFTLKQDGKKILCTVENQHVYIEETEDDYLTYVYNGSRWMEQYVDIEEFNQIVEYPEFGYTAEFFEYADGYYYGKTYKMNMALDEYFEEIEQQFVDSIKQQYKDEIKKIESTTKKKVTVECEALVTEYIIQVVDNQIAAIACEITINGTFGEETVTFVQSLGLLFSDINNTVIEKPKL